LPVTDALVVPVAGDPPRTLCLRHMLVAMTQVAEGDWYAAAAALDRALELGEQVDDRDVLWNLANAALQLGADRAQQHFYGYALSRAREAGAVTSGIHDDVLIIGFRGVGARKGAPDLGECGL
jgi:hypothetical protein